MTWAHNTGPGHDCPWYPAHSRPAAGSVCILERRESWPKLTPKGVCTTPNLLRHTTRTLASMPLAVDEGPDTDEGTTSADASASALRPPPAARGHQKAHAAGCKAHCRQAHRPPGLPGARPLGDAAPAPPLAAPARCALRAAPLAVSGVAAACSGCLRCLTT